MPLCRCRVWLPLRVFFFASGSAVGVDSGVGNGAGAFGNGGAVVAAGRAAGVRAIVGSGVSSPTKAERNRRKRLCSDSVLMDYTLRYEEVCGGSGWK